jgi:hypothetical protein
MLAAQCLPSVCLVSALYLPAPTDSQVYKIKVCVLLFFSYFSIMIRFEVRKYHSLGYAINRPADGIRSRSQIRAIKRWQ